MARLKSRPLQRTTKRRLQDRDRVLREGLRTSSSKRLRLQSQAERSTSTSKKGKKKKGKSPQKEPEDAHLPPELRRAGLMAHMAIPKGKCFGPFSGKIVSKEKSPDKMHFFVSEVGDKKRKSHYFYAHKNEKDKCSWLSRLQSATSKQRQNIVAYNCPRGVCFEALKDIAAGDELMVLFDASFKGASHSGSAENTPTVSYVTDETGKQIAVVPLDKEVDQTKVYVTSTTEDHDHSDDDTDGEDENNDRELERDDSLEEEDVEMEDGDIYEENGDESEDDDDDDDYDDDDDDDDDDGDSMCDSDSDFFPGSQMQLTRFTAVNTRSNHDGNYNFNSADATSQSHKKRKKTGRQKKIPSIKETTVVDADTGAETVKYYCAHCMEAFIDKDKALEHTAALECLSKEFQCSTCTLEFRNASLLLRHLCGGKPKCNICDEEYEDLTQLQDHKQTPPMDHLPKCAKCNLQFQDLETKDRHVQTQHGPSEKQAECPVCHKTYNKSYLKEHMISHSGSDALKCQECGKKFSSKSNLNKHRKKHAPNYVRAVNKPREKKFSCPEEECEKTFDSQHALKSHQRSHTGERPFHCEQCSWKFTQKTHLTRHIRSVHDKVPRSQQSEGRSNAPATCEVCNKVYVNSRVLLVHVQSVHEGLRPYKCDYCDATYTQRGHLWRHKHASHFEKEEVQKKYTSDKFCCNFDGCEQVYDTQPELVEHVKVHVGTTDKTCMCNECGATFVSQQNLAKHSRRRHLEPMSSPHKTHRCEKCDKTFFTSYQLVVHFRCHTGEKPYKCDLCGKEFVQKSGLRKHIRCKRCPMVEGRSITNKSARKYACEQCDKMFPGPSDLKAHQRTHTGEKPYQCLVCQKGFSQPGNLTKHVRFVHNKEQRPKEKVREKKFFCSLCGKAFLCPSSLAMHCRTHSGDKPFACEECGQAFAQAGNLKKHVKRWHGDGSVLLRKRRKGKGQKSSNESTEAEVRSQQTATNESQATEASPSTLHETPGTQSNVQHDDTCDTNSADTAVTSALTNTQSTQISQGRQTTCTPLNTPSHLYGNTPLNTAVTTNSLNVQPASQRIPILFGFVAPMEPNTVPSSQAPGASRIPVEQNITMHRTNVGGPLNAPAIPPQSTNLGSLSAQELQQVVISRMLASENTEGAFLPPNVSGLPSNSSPRPPVLLPHVHSLLNPTGMNSAGEVTVWPFSANSGMFQQ